MATHLAHSLLVGVPLLVLLTIVPSLSPLALFVAALGAIVPTSTLLLWDVLPISFPAAAAVSTALGLRTAGAALVAAWVLEELRARKWAERFEVLLVQSRGDVVEEVTLVAEGEIEVEPMLEVEAEEGQVARRRGGRKVERDE